MVYIVGKVSLPWFRIAIETGSEKWSPRDLCKIFESHVTMQKSFLCNSSSTNRGKIVLYSKRIRKTRFYLVFHTFHAQKMSGTTLKMGKTVERTLLLFQERAIISAFWVKNGLNLRYLYLNRRFKGGFYSEFSPKVKRFGCRRNVMKRGAGTFFPPKKRGQGLFLMKQKKGARKLCPGSR